MGRLFDSMRAVMKSRGATQPLADMDKVDQAGGTDAAEQLLQQVVAGAEIDPDDPDFAPVEGVDVDEYARLCRMLVDAGPSSDEAKALGIVEAEGIDPSKWKQIADVWNERVVRNNAVKMRYSATFIS